MGEATAAGMAWLKAVPARDAREVRSKRLVLRYAPRADFREA
jgi:hypothetical protein